MRRVFLQPFWWLLVTPCVVLLPLCKNVVRHRNVATRISSTIPCACSSQHYLRDMGPHSLPASSVRRTLLALCSLLFSHVPLATYVLSRSLLSVSFLHTLLAPSSSFLAVSRHPFLLLSLPHTSLHPFPSVFSFVSVFSCTSVSFTLALSANVAHPIPIVPLMDDTCPAPYLPSWSLFRLSLQDAPSRPVPHGS